MGRHYDQLSLRERIEIELLQRSGQTVRAIALRIGRSASTISRELRRNARTTKQWSGPYDGERAHDLAARRRRWDARFKLARQPDLAENVRKRLAMGHSPEQIAGRLTLEHGGPVISHESIYRFIYHCSAQKNYWHRLLPRAKSRRGRLGLRGGSPASYIKGRRPIGERTKEAADRRQPGHWEADFMLFAKYGDNILVTHERQCRYLMIDHPPDRKAQRTAERLIAMLGQVPAALRKTLAFDNGSEFAFHYKIQEEFGMQTYFCDPHAPWQKGGVENAIGRLRRYLPRKTKLADITPGMLETIIRLYNDTPRKCLDFKTPAEAFSILKSSVALQT